MKSIRRTTQFKKDVKRIQRRGKNLEKLKRVVLLLVEGKPLPAALRDHELTGNWKGIRDLHIEPDWLLLYDTEPDEIVLIRTGSHSDLF